MLYQLIILSGSLASFSDVALSHSATEYKQGRTAYFLATASTEQDTVHSVSIKDLKTTQAGIVIVYVTNYIVAPAYATNYHGITLLDPSSTGFSIQLTVSHYDGVTLPPVPIVVEAKLHVVVVSAQSGDMHSQNMNAKFLAGPDLASPHTMSEEFGSLSITKTVSFSSESTADSGAILTNTQVVLVSVAACVSGLLVVLGVVVYIKHTTATAAYKAISTAHAIVPTPGPAVIHTDAPDVQLLV